ncbi:MAG: hypothetical protein HY074_10855 [Deltaproteobacteria bacterium]|nr:hypothetical protein [Deltaproteobacteria bacterium]
MPMLTGPSHHLYYASLHRRRLWLSHLTEAFEKKAGPDFLADRKRLDSSFARTLRRLSADSHLGIQTPLPLHVVVDDTPIDSFLTTLSEELDAYEHNLFELMHKAATEQSWFASLEEVSQLWGRELAHESRIALAKADAPTDLMPEPASRSLRGLTLMFYSVLQGGDFAWKPLLFRRRTDREIQYELRACPHRKPGGSLEGANLACRLEAMIYRGFAQAFFSDVEFERRSPNAGAYCVDELTLR